MSEKQSLTLDTVVVRLPDLIFSTVDNDLIILSITNSKYYGVDVVGDHVWKLIEQPIAITDICAALLNEFEIDRSTCESDVIAFLDQLLSEKLIDVKTADSHNPTP